MPNASTQTRRGKKIKLIKKKEEPKAEELQKKIGEWLSKKENNENDLLDFLLDECGCKKYWKYECDDFV